MNAGGATLHVLCSNELRLTDHRLLWWLLAQQAVDDEGVPTGTVRAGWRSQAMKDLGLLPVQVWKSQERLKRAGIIKCELFQRNVRICGEAFSQ